MISVNKEAMKLVRVILGEAEKLNIAINKLSNGTTVIDMGQKVEGGWLAGKYYALVTMGGIGEVTFGRFRLNETELPAVHVAIDQPLLACVASQIAGWRLQGGDFVPILSGPARALATNPDRYFRWIDYRDDSAEGVICIQTDREITVEIAESVAKACRLQPEHLYILVAPNSSLVCAIQVSARTVEQGLHKLAEEGFDLKSIAFAYGYAPIATLIKDELQAMGRINDCLLYGGTATYYVHSEDQLIREVIGKIPSSYSREYGIPFVDIFERHNRDFYQIDPALHSPAVININNLSSGHTFTAGEVDYAVLRRSLLGP
ncbi:MAG: methenyltetrahydromethanopterin cyclohydrolase [Chloroflexi bacterium]|nr:methenyltetrahydromethanopterin cyclohydrolase [Chloroflexota bacterium]MCL5075374.1 methenyltetrahydromethanopterin cyclohydrolase [Chloroflexota bacterium]